MSTPTNAILSVLQKMQVPNPDMVQKSSKALGNIAGPSLPPGVGNNKYIYNMTGSVPSFHVDLSTPKGKKAFLDLGIDIDIPALHTPSPQQEIIPGNPMNSATKAAQNALALLDPPTAPTVSQVAEYVRSGYLPERTLPFGTIEQYTNRGIPIDSIPVQQTVDADGYAAMVLAEGQKYNPLPPTPVTVVEPDPWNGITGSPNTYEQNLTSAQKKAYAERNPNVVPSVAPQTESFSGGWNNGTYPDPTTFPQGDAPIEAYIGEPRQVYQHFYQNPRNQLIAGAIAVPAVAGGVYLATRPAPVEEELYAYGQMPTSFV